MWLQLVHCWDGIYMQRAAGRCRLRDEQDHLSVVAAGLQSDSSKSGSIRAAMIGPWSQGLNGRESLSAKSSAEITARIGMRRRGNRSCISPSDASANWAAAGIHCEHLLNFSQYITWQNESLIWSLRTEIGSWGANKLFGMAEKRAMIKTGAVADQRESDSQTSDLFWSGGVFLFFVVLAFNNGQIHEKAGY